MTRSAAAEEYDALGRLNLGLRLRLIELFVALPALMLAASFQHPLALWFQRAVWVLGPLSGLLLISGANGFGARAAGLAFTMATAAEGYASMMGFYGSPVALGQVPFADTASEILGLIGMLSMVAAMRGTAEDARAEALVGRSYRAAANIWVTLACALVVRMVIWQVDLSGLPSTIIIGTVVAFAGVALMSVLGLSEAIRTLKNPASESEAQAEGDQRPG